MLFLRSDVKYLQGYWKCLPSRLPVSSFLLCQMTQLKSNAKSAQDVSVSRYKLTNINHIFIIKIPTITLLRKATVPNLFAPYEQLSTVQGWMMPGPAF